MAWILLIVVLAYFLLVTPIQYNSIKELKEKQKKMNVSQPEMYENMSYTEFQRHLHQQGIIYYIPASILASIIYKIKHR
ncbi:DUF3949 domain-containing protein [Bacillus sp. XF8]|uniref:DUF3949 domain-containing protein n=1 Tax=Bacillus sp. XF8 TaxID=2819289 RepID=UPI001AA0716E|nr:DUF3949 domain-containing protein [Bacillus sp. XF8]MBO1581250.1 DUF3949 domain-containing protein [Bacillus sp. XF8]